MTSRYQIEISVTAHGYVEIDAPTPDFARNKLRSYDVEISFGPQARVDGLDTSLLEGGAMLRIERVIEVEEY